jgi:hypothetical protein
VHNYYFERALRATAYGPRARECNAEPEARREMQRHMIEEGKRSI